MPPAPPIDPERLLADLQALRGFGACGSGVVRPSLSEPDMAARQWLCGRMGEAGLDATIDGVGNVIGRSGKPGKALLLGSHSDSQPTGGWLDGALGVVYAIEVARALRDCPETRDLAVDAASWVDEEGTYLGFLGSRSFCGEALSEAIAGAVSRDGARLSDALSAAGLAGRPCARLEPGRYRGYLEAHIEQGPYLESEGKRIGVVTAIVGIRGLRVRFLGQQNHAGTTPMPLRRDAGAALIEFAHRIQRSFPAVAGPRSVWTIGRVAFEPGAPSIIPGRAELVLQFRDPEEARLDALDAQVVRLMVEANRAGPVEVVLEHDRDQAPAREMDGALQQHLAAAAERHAAGRWMAMPSAAGHDAQVIAARLPSAMLFVPSKGGISHDFAEDTDEADIVLGCQVMASAAASILAEARS